VVFQDHKLLHDRPCGHVALPLIIAACRSAKSTSACARRSIKSGCSKEKTSLGTLDRRTAAWHCTRGVEAALLIAMSTAISI